MAGYHLTNDMPMTVLIASLILAKCPLIYSVNPIHHHCSIISLRLSAGAGVVDIFRPPKGSGFYPPPLLQILAQTDIWSSGGGYLWSPHREQIFELRSVVGAHFVVPMYVPLGGPQR